MKENEVDIGLMVEDEASGLSTTADAMAEDEVASLLTASDIVRAAYEAAEVVRFQSRDAAFTDAEVLDGFQVLPPAMSGESMIGWLSALAKGGMAFAPDGGKPDGATREEACGIGSAQEDGAAGEAEGADAFGAIEGDSAAEGADEADAVGAFDAADETGLADLAGTADEAVRLVDPWDEALTLIDRDAVADLRPLRSSSGLCLYSARFMTDAYARWLFLAREGDDAATFASCVREESRLYPRPMKAVSLDREPFYLSEARLAKLHEVMRESKDYADISRTEASNGDVYYFSAEYLSDGYAKSLAEWYSVECWDSP